LGAWTQSPSTHPLLGDWRRVGYRRGAAEPRASGPVVAARARGIEPNRPEDVSARIQGVLDELGQAGGGVLQLDAGRYVCDDALFIHDANVVLAGAGKRETTLFFSRPLAECVAPGFQWSWTGGHVYFVARERLAASMAKGWNYTPGAEGWLAGDTL